MNGYSFKSVLFFACLFFIGFSSAFAEGSKKFLGRWDCRGDDGQKQLVFNSQTQLVYDGEPYAYTLLPDVIRLMTIVGSADYRYSLKGDSLSITFPDGSRTACARAVAAQSGNGTKHVKEDVRLLRGTFCHWSGSSTSSSSYSSTMRASFDGKGRFSYGSESSFSAREGLLSSGSPSSIGAYTVEGENVRLTFGDSSAGVATVHYRAGDGTITELMFNGKLYAAGFCN